jgi:Zn-dependent protease with chaperone function
MLRQSTVSYILTACVLLTFTVLVIQYEGRKARESLNGASGQVADAISDGIADGIERSIDKAAEVPGKIMRDARGVLLSDSTDTGTGKKAGSAENSSPNGVSRAKKASGDKRADPMPDGVATDDKPATPIPSGPKNADQPLATSDPKGSFPADVATTKVELNPEQLLRETVKVGQELAKTADDFGQEVLSLSLDEEVQLGKELNREVRRKHEVSSSSTATKRVRDLATPLLKHVEREGFSYTFTVLASPEINAFSHVGGYVYVNQGILKFTNDDAELQFVLAHEIAHIDLGHCRRGLAYAARAGDLAGNNGAGMVLQAYHLISLGYSEDQEHEADEWAFRRMITIGRTRDEALALTRHFARQFTDKLDRRSSLKYLPAAAVIADEIEKHLRSHPPAIERVRQLEGLGDTGSKETGSSSE